MLSGARENTMFEEEIQKKNSDRIYSNCFRIEREKPNFCTMYLRMRHKYVAVVMRLIFFFKTYASNRQK